MNPIDRIEDGRRAELAVTMKKDDQVSRRIAFGNGNGFRADATHDDAKTGSFESVQSCRIRGMGL
jgi:hypothetical protein